MEKSFVLYNRVEIEGKLVECIYFVDGVCRGQPYGKMHSGGVLARFYKPSEEDLKKYRKNEADFKKYPRFTAFQEHLKAIGLEK